MPFPWTQQPIHFIDFEGNLSSGVLEYGVITLQNASLLNPRTRVCRLSGPLRPEEFATHRLDLDSLRKAAPFSEDFELFAQLREAGPFAAHFAGVENALIKSVWPYARRSPDFARDTPEDSVEWGPWIDTGQLYRRFYPGLESAKLSDLVALFALQPSLDALAEQYAPPARRHYHAALYDALAGALLLKRLGEIPELQNYSCSWLLAMSTANPQKRDSIRQGNLF